jgi:hypothetical protein
MSERPAPEQQPEKYREKIEDFLNRKREWIDEEEQLSINERYGNLVDAVEHNLHGPQLRDYEDRIDRDGWESLTEEEYAETVLLR